MTTRQCIGYAGRVGTLLASLTVVLAACGSAEGSESSTESTVAVESESSTESTVAVEPDSSAESTVAAEDQAVVDGALLEATDLGDGWEVLDAAANFPNDAELARTIPACEEFAELVFAGGERHGVGGSRALASGDNVVFTYVALFPTEDDAAALVAAAATPEFDECWARFNDVAVPLLPFGIESSTYVSGEPPGFPIDATSSTVKYLEGSIVIDGAEYPDTCVCAFAQVGRAVVEVHSAAPVFDPARRAEVVQTAIARVEAGLGSETVDLAAMLDAVASSPADIGPGAEFVADSIAAGAYDDAYRRRQLRIDSCASVSRPVPHGATFGDMVDGRGWLYIDTESAQLPYVAHWVMVLPDDAAAIAIMDDLRSSPDFPGCVAEWTAEVNATDADDKNDAWAPGSVQYTATEARFGDPVTGLPDDQLHVQWDLDAAGPDLDAETENFSLIMARYGSTILGYSGSGPAADTAVVLGSRVESAMG